MIAGRTSNGELQYTVQPDWHLIGKNVISAIQDDWGAPPHSLIIEASLTDERVVRIVIPYDADSTQARVRVDDQPLFLGYLTIRTTGGRN